MSSPENNGQQLQIAVAGGGQSAAQLNARVAALAKKRAIMGGASVRSRGMAKVFNTLADLAESTSLERGQEPAPRLYARGTSKPTRYSQVYRKQEE